MSVHSQTKAPLIRVCVQLPASAVNVILLAFAAEQRAATLLLLLGAGRLPLSIDISRPNGAQQQTRHTPQLHDGTDHRE